MDKIRNHAQTYGVGECTICHSSYVKSSSKQQRTCSLRCRAILQHRESYERRFWQNVNKDGPMVNLELGPCWIWIGSMVGDGQWQQYGRFGKRLATHIVLEMNGIILKSGERACHRCDVSECVRFLHLFVGSDRDNYWDARTKGRRNH